MVMELSLVTAASESLGFSILYVASVYCIPGRYANLPRDSPGQIYARFVAVSIATLLCLLRLRWLLHSIPHRHESGAYAALVALFLTSVLYLGAITTCALTFFYEARHCKKSFFALANHNLRQRWILIRRNRAIHLRNLLVGPITEEIVFRGCILPMLLRSSLSYSNSIFISPLFFGVAHLHHLKRRLGEGTPLFPAIAMSLFQFAYTTLFGIYTAFLFARTGHLASAITAHIFCNHMGLPDLDFLSLPPEKFQNQNRSIDSSLYKARFGILAIYLLGILLFAVLLLPCTAYSGDIRSCW